MDLGLMRNVLDADEMLTVGRGVALEDDKYCVLGRGDRIGGN